MGVSGIWEYMSKYAQEINIGALRGSTLAVDGHIWLFESSKGTQAYGRSGASYLVTFFNRCQRLREHGIEPVVVFDNVQPNLAIDLPYSDGLARIKKSKRSGGKGWNMDALSDLSNRVAKVQKMLTSMGIVCIVGGADGEAQCAHLELNNLVSGCITPDFDYFLFGGRELYKIEFTNGGRSVKESVSWMSMSVMERLNLNRNRLIALAMLLGCDYFEGGVGRVGIVNALEILAEFTCHDDDHPISILDRFASYHRKEIPVRSEDSEQKTKIRKAPYIISAGFPNIDSVLDAVNVYLLPTVQKMTVLPVISSQLKSSEAVSKMLEVECSWKPERFSREMSVTKKKIKAAESEKAQSHIPDYFSSTRRRVQPVVETCSQEDRAKCSQREWAALERLRNRSGLYSNKVTCVVEEVTPKKVAGQRTNQRPEKRKIIDETTPTTSTQKRRLNGNDDDAICSASNTSSVIILD